MRAVPMVVPNILGEQSLQMAFTQRNNVVQQVSSMPPLDRGELLTQSEILDKETVLPTNLGPSLRAATRRELYEWFSTLRRSGFGTCFRSLRHSSANGGAPGARIHLQLATELAHALSHALKPDT